MTNAKGQTQTIFVINTQDDNNISAVLAVLDQMMDRMTDEQLKKISNDVWDLRRDKADDKIARGEFPELTEEEIDLALSDGLKATQVYKKRTGLSHFEAHSMIMHCKRIHKEALKEALAEEDRAA